ncbi:hypothetical protein [Novosphingobium pentaromativorans]|uniref:hypothetical protein n=1 Tax=Novosphingobium pentaromativorans TaxID=205844 RepID=UPI000304BB98|nr:hypothetical protein [Novosphingobium pentaromativorans]
MPRYLLIALNGPTTGEGDEAEYNRWYNQEHKPDLESVDGTVSVRRFKTVWQNRIDKPYISVTEIEADSPEQIMAEMGKKAAQFSDKIDRTTSIALLGVELDTSIE